MDLTYATCAVASLAVCQASIFSGPLATRSMAPSVRKTTKSYQSFICASYSRENQNWMTPMTPPFKAAQSDFHDGEFCRCLFHSVMPKLESKGPGQTETDGKKTRHVGHDSTSFKRNDNRTTQHKLRKHRTESRFVQCRGIDGFSGALQLCNDLIE